jgi:hypothetical protein
MKLKGKPTKGMLRSRWKLLVRKDVMLEKRSICEETEEEEKCLKMDGEAWLLDIPH